MWNYRTDLDPDDMSEEWVWARLRARRDQLLSATDWTQLADVPAETQQQWAPYRQSLRDLPQSAADPRKATWPKRPGNSR